MGELLDPWSWPKVPFDWRHVPPPDDACAQPCRIETLTGATVQGYFLTLVRATKSITFRTSFDAPVIDLPFARFLRLTLTTPLRSVDQTGRIRAERVPKAAQLREYKLHRNDAVIATKSLGHVENEDGLFLFTPGPDDYSMLREFVPRGMYRRFEAAATALDTAAEKWIGTPAELLAAVERQRRMSIQPIGQSMVELGMVTREQLEQALAQPSNDRPLGERMVQAGLISKADLQTAIAHKMGYPYVDLTRFPIDPEAARKLPIRQAVAHRALPIMLKGDRLFIAVDRPSRTAKLSSLYALNAFTLVPVLASKGQILLAVSAMNDHDVWREHVTVQAAFFATTR